MTEQLTSPDEQTPRPGEVGVLPSEDGRFRAEPLRQSKSKAKFVVVGFAIAMAAVGGTAWFIKAKISQHQATEAARKKEKEQEARADGKRDKKTFALLRSEQTAGAEPSEAVVTPRNSLPVGFGASAPPASIEPIPLRSSAQAQPAVSRPDPVKSDPSVAGKSAPPAPVATMMLAEPSSAPGIPVAPKTPSPGAQPAPEDSIAAYKAKVDALQAQAAKGGGTLPGSANPVGSPGQESSSLPSTLGGRRGRTVQEFARLSSLRSPVTSTQQAQAANLGDRSMLLARGAVIQCVLLTQLHSNVPGSSACVVPEDVWSDDGRVLLIPKGSTFAGSYQGTLRNGDSRIAVVWHRLKSADGIVVDVDSPGADGVGTMGVDGHVDNHWGKRIGAALLLSLIDDAVSIEVAKQSDGSATRTPTATTDTTKSMSEQVLSSTINIPPTISKNRGARLAIVVQRDLWFDSVYNLIKQ